MPNPCLNECKSMAAMNYFLIIIWYAFKINVYIAPLLLDKWDWGNYYMLSCHNCFCFYVVMSMFLCYCKNIVIRGVPIFVDFVVQEIHEIKYTTKYKISTLLFCAKYETTNQGSHEPRNFPQTTKIGSHEWKYFYSTCLKAMWTFVI